MKVVYLNEKTIEIKLNTILKINVHSLTMCISGIYNMFAKIKQGRP